MFLEWGILIWGGKLFYSSEKICIKILRHEEQSTFFKKDYQYAIIKKYKPWKLWQRQENAVNAVCLDK